MCCAARRRLRGVIGIEYSPEHAARADENVRRLRGRRTETQVLAMPAQEHDYAGVTAVFLFNPFGAETLRSVLKKLESSWRAAPRGVRIAYANPVWDAVFADSGWLRRDEAAAPPRASDADHVVSFWTTLG